MSRAERMAHVPNLPRPRQSPMIPQTAFARLAAAVGIGLAGLAGGCFIETQPPPTFRYECSSDAECPDGHTCDGGLCQIACTLSTFSEDCPSDEGYATCFNGHCTHVCQISKDRCSAPQSCIGLPIDVVDPEPGTAPASDFGFCAEACQMGGCPDTEVCVEGVCLATCDENDPNPFPCGTAATCLGGLCIPNEAFSQ